MSFRVGALGTVQEAELWLSAPQTEPLAGSPLAVPPFDCLCFSSACCNFFSSQTQTQQNPGGCLLQCLQACALLQQAAGQYLETVTQSSTGVWSPSFVVAWPQPVPRYSCSGQRSWILFLLPLLPVLECIICNSGRISLLVNRKFSKLQLEGE